MKAAPRTNRANTLARRRIEMLRSSMKPGLNPATHHNFSVAIASRADTERRQALRKAAI